MGLHHGGYVYNAGTATISSFGGVGVYITGGAGTIFNAGNILNAGGTHNAIDLLTGGHLTNAPTGTISSSADVGVYIKGAAGTVVNAGQISAGGTHTGVNLHNGGSVTNQVGGTISSTYGFGVYLTGGVGSVLNAGLITSPNGTQSAVHLHQGGYVSNAVTGTIDGTGHVGLYIGGSVGTFGGSAGTVINAGHIYGGATGPGVELGKGGLISNAATGVIFSADHSGIYVIGAAARVFNAGSITDGGTSGSGGVALEAGGGYVNNASTGTITGVQKDGVFISGGAGTVTNAGVITSGRLMRCCSRPVSRTG